jgi:dihydroorotate dehydrogenase subfamily 1
MTRVLVQGCFVNADGVFEGQVEITDGIITNIGDNLGSPDFIFDSKHLIFPGFGDIHVHAREDPKGAQNYKEDYQSLQDAACNGGVTHVAAMPNTPQPLVTEELLAWHKERTQELHVHVLNYAGVGPAMRPLHSHVPYKVYTGPSVGPLFFKNEQELRETLQHYFGKHVSFHVEDYDVLMKCKDKDTHDRRRPVRCVNTALKYVLELIEEFQLKAKLCHWSTGGESLDMIKEHREKGFLTALEVSPLHLFFNTDLLEEQPELWPYLQMNPALQSKEHQQELIQALREGVIDFLATDHAPHLLAEKFKNFGGERGYLALKEKNKELCRKVSCKDGVSGTPQLDTFSLITTWLMKEHKFTPQDIARVAAENPGKFVNQFHEGKGKFGRIEKGHYGSFTVLDLKTPTRYTREMVRSKVGWSPFEKVEFPGSLAMTMIQGVPVYIKKETSEEVEEEKNLDLSTSLAGLALLNPIFNASGPRCTTQKELEEIGRSKAGAIITKSCTLNPREGNPTPRYVDFKDGSVNSINSMGLPNLGYKQYAKIIPHLAQYNKPLFASVSGLSLEHNLVMIGELSKVPELHAIELNLSCPNLVGKPQMGYDFEQSRHVLAEVARVCTKPLGVKLPPYFDFAHFQAMAEILNTSTVQFVTCINSLGNGLVIDPKKEEVVIKPKGGFGGVGGSIIKPFGLSNVRKMRELLKPEIKIIGVGGITSGMDVFEYVLAGADVVQVGTAYHQEGPEIFARLERELKKVMKEKGYMRLSDFRNKLKVIA